MGSATRAQRARRWLGRQGRELIAVGVVTLALIVVLRPMSGPDYIVYIVAFLLFSFIFRRWERIEREERGEGPAGRASP